MKELIKKTKKNKNDYLKNKDLLAEVISCKEQGKMSNRLAEMLTLLCDRYAMRGNFAGYTYNDDMRGFAMLMLVRTWDAFDPSKSPNAFAFYTQCIKHSFMQFLNNEKKQRDLRDELLVDSGLMPSHTYMTEYENDNRHLDSDNISYENSGSSINDDQESFDEAANSF